MSTATISLISAARARRAAARRPQSEWIINHVEALRIVADDLFARADARTRPMTEAERKVHGGGRAKYMLSGLLRCNACGSHYVIADKYSYACSSYLDGGNCKNGVRVNRESIEATILGPIRDGLRDPAWVKEMAGAMERSFANQIADAKQRFPGTLRSWMLGWLGCG